MPVPVGMSHLMYCKFLHVLNAWQDELSYMRTGADAVCTPLCMCVTGIISHAGPSTVAC